MRNARLPKALTSSLAGVAILLGACSLHDTSYLSNGSGETGGNAGATGGTGASGGTGGAESQLAILPESYTETTYQLPEPDDDVACSGAANPTATLGEVFLAQTHAISPGHPFFYLMADRPALLAVDVTGEGVAPEVSVEATIDGTPLGRLCLAGPERLPSVVDTSTPQREERYTVTLPATWLKPGLALTLQAGGATRTYSTAALAVGASSDLNLILVTIDVLNYNEGKPDPKLPDSFLGDLAGAVPARLVRLGRFPTRIPLPEFVSSADDEGSSPVLLTKRICETNEAASASCATSTVSESNLTISVFRLLMALQAATGEYAFTHYHANTSNLAGDALGGTKASVSPDYGGLFLQAFGLSIGLSQWGFTSYPYTTPTENDDRYPYGGVNADGGGRGESWNYYQNVDEFTSPICQIATSPNYREERSDAMYRSNACDETRSSIAGPWDGFGDYSALAAFRFWNGASAYGGTVPYAGGTSKFHFKKELGWPELVRDAAGTRTLAREYQPAELRDEETLPFKVPQKWDVPVALVYGSFHPGDDAANVVYEPLTYSGNLPSFVDPTDPLTFADLAAASSGSSSYGDYFYWPRDITLKVTYEDGTVIHAVYPHDSYAREWNSSTFAGAWRNDLIYFALTFPGETPIDAVEVFDRPFCVRGTTEDFPGNISFSPAGVTASNFMDSATLRGAWRRP